MVRRRAVLFARFVNEGRKLRGLDAVVAQLGVCEKKHGEDKLQFGDLHMCNSYIYWLSGQDKKKVERFAASCTAQISRRKRKATTKDATAKVANGSTVSKEEVGTDDFDFNVFG